jgi:hypothetical protein
LFLLAIRLDDIEAAKTLERPLNYIVEPFLREFPVAAIPVPSGHDFAAVLNPAAIYNIVR